MSLFNPQPPTADDPPSEDTPPAMDGSNDSEGVPEDPPDGTGVMDNDMGMGGVKDPTDPLLDPDNPNFDEMNDPINPNDSESVPMDTPDGTDQMDSYMDNPDQMDNGMGLGMGGLDDPDPDDPMFDENGNPMDPDEFMDPNDPTFDEMDQYMDGDPTIDDPTMDDPAMDDPDLQPPQGLTAEEEPVDEEPPVDPDTGHNIYPFTTFIEQYSNLAKDVQEMMIKLKADDKSGASKIYRDGKNSIIYENGIEVGTRSLASLSTAETLAMTGNAIFNQYTNGLADENGEFLGKDVRLYADSIVTDALVNNKSLADKTLASEAVALLNIWMYMVNEVDKIVHACQKKEVFDLDVHPIDRVAALWIGDSEQGKAQPDADAGHTLYAMAEYQGSKFNVDTNQANNDVLELLAQMKSILSSGNACLNDDQLHRTLRTMSTRVISKMQVPIVQGLIHYIRNTDQVRGILYANAFVPLTKKCNRGSYEYLERRLLADEKFHFSKFETDAVIEAIYSTLHCLGLSCADIGKYNFVDEFNCVDRPSDRPFADVYIPDTDVNTIARLDIDIRELGILMDEGAISAAADLYMYGRNAVASDSETMSLQDLATDSNRNKVPEYSVYSQYYNDGDYADNFVKSGLLASKMPGATLEQRKEIVVKGSQYVVVHLGALTAMHEALSDCKYGRLDDAMASWDKAAALLIGSMGHTNYGAMFTGLSKERCKEFNTCRGDDARVNAELRPLLFSGKTEISSKSCSALSESIDDIKSLLNVPLVQSALSYSETNKHAKKGDGSLASGYVFSRAVLPLIEKVDPQAASVIDKNMDLSGRSNPEEVYTAFKSSYSALDVDCSMVGKGEYDACTAEPTSHESSGDHAGEVVGILVAIIGIVLLVFLYKFKKPSTKKQEEQPVEFVINDREDSNLV